MVYLNSALEFEGGATRFFPSSDATGAPLASVSPRAGSLIVFDHSLWHDGEIVTRGMKYIMRSDILYESEAPDRSRISGRRDTHSGYVWSVVELADGSLASGGRDKTVRIWRRNAASLACQEVLRGHANSITALLPAGADELWSASRDRSVRIWRREQGAFRCAADIDAHDGTVLCLAKVDEERVASGGADGVIRLWSRNGTCVGQFAAKPTWVWDIKVLDAETLVSASEDGALRLWRSTDGECLNTIITDGGPVRSLAPLGDGELVASGSADGIVRIWRLSKTKETRSLELVQRLFGHSADVRALVELPNGWLATGAEDNRVFVWNPATGLAEKTFWHSDFVTTLAVVGHGLLASGSYDGTIRIWPGFVSDRPGRES
jgi:WD40 repeat protein